ncbi:hypothetical protein ACO0QE_000179 [Hanseniaspora vineae]
MNEPDEVHATPNEPVASLSTPPIPTKRPERHAKIQSTKHSESNKDECISESFSALKGNDFSSAESSRSHAVEAPQESQKLDEKQAEESMQKERSTELNGQNGGESMPELAESIKEFLPGEKSLSDVHHTGTDGKVEHLIKADSEVCQKEDESNFVETSPNVSSQKKQLDTDFSEETNGTENEFETEAKIKPDESFLNSTGSSGVETQENARDNLISKEDLSNDRHEEAQRQVSGESNLTSLEIVSEIDSEKLAPGPAGLAKSSEPKDCNNKELEKTVELTSTTFEPKRAPPPVRPKPSSKIAAFQKMLQQQQEEENVFVPKRPASAARPHSFSNRKTSSSSFNSVSSVAPEAEGETKMQHKDNEETLGKKASSNPFFNNNPNFVSNLNGILAGGFGGASDSSAPATPHHPSTKNNTSASFSSVPAGERATTTDASSEKENSNTEACPVSKSTEEEKLADSLRTRRVRGPKGRKLPSKLQNVAKVKIEATQHISVLTNWTVSFGVNTDQKRLTEQRRRSTEQQLDEILDGYVNLSEDSSQNVSEKPLQLAHKEPLHETSKGILNAPSSEGLLQHVSSEAFVNVSANENHLTKDSESQENVREIQNNVSNQREDSTYDETDSRTKGPEPLNNGPDSREEEAVNHDRTDAACTSFLQRQNEKDDKLNSREHCIPKVPLKRPVKRLSDNLKLPADSC